MEFIRDLRLQDKLLPNRNPSVAWFLCFLPALLGYFSILTTRINTKAIVGSIETRDQKAMSRIFSKNAKVEEIVTGHDWTEGPLLIEEDSSSYLIFSDTVQNRIMRWEEGRGLFTVGESLYLSRSGCAGENAQHCESLKEPGSNGLIRATAFSTTDTSVNLVVCQHGNRAVSLLFENGTRVSLVTHFEGKRLNSPNDLAWSDSGNLYFTDPTYGLVRKDGSIVRAELDFAGVYFLTAAEISNAILSRTPSEKLVAVDRSMTSPNGLAFNTRYSRLYVSDSKEKVIMSFEVHPELGTLSNGRVFYNASNEVGRTFDGMKVDTAGNLYIAGSGGVLILSVVGEVVGSVKLEMKASNLAISSDGWMYITADSSIIRIKTLARPVAIASPRFRLS